MAELIISSNQPCCPPKGTLWREPLSKSLKLLDVNWESVTGGTVISVNGKQGVVNITAEDLLGSASVSNSVYTSNGWAQTATSPIQGSNSLITSGGVYTAFETLNSTLSSIQLSISSDAGQTLKKSDIEQQLSSVSTNATVPSSEAVIRYINSKTIAGQHPVTTQVEGDVTKIGVTQATQAALGVVKLATEQDYTNGDGFSVLTPSLIKHKLDDLKMRIDVNKEDIMSLDHHARVVLQGEVSGNYTDIQGLKDTIQTLTQSLNILRQEFNDYKTTHP